jgi:predicted DNA-binding protein (MmcQ/YjbR family)
MVTETVCRELALSFPETHEEPHFDKASFRIGKKIFATLNVKENRLSVKLSEIDQDVFSAFDCSIIYPVPNKWGKQGWTLVELARVRQDMLRDILATAYCEVAPSRLGDIVRGESDDK